MPHELMKKSLVDRISPLDWFLLKVNGTGDEKRIMYNNLNRRRSWLKLVDALSTSAKVSFTSRDGFVMHLVDLKVIVYYELNQV